MSDYRFSLSAEVGGDFAPFFGGPFYDGVADWAVGGKPCVGTRKQGQGLLGLGRGGERGLRMSPFEPRKGVARVGVDGGGEIALASKQGRKVYHGEVFG